MEGISIIGLLLESAITRNSTSEVTWLIQNGIDVNSCTSMRRTILHYATGNCRLDMVQHLVKLGANINTRDRHFATPLHYAVSQDTTEGIKKMIQEEYSEIAHHECADHETCEIKLQMLVENQRIKLIDCLISLGADVNATFDCNVTSLNEAIRLKNERAVKVLSELGLAAERSPMTCMRQHGVTALFPTVQQGEKEVVKRLVHFGADVNATYRSAFALNDAVRSENGKIVETLLKNGADINVHETVGIPLVYHAVRSLGRDNKKWTQKTDRGKITCLAQVGADFNQHEMVMFPVLTATTLNATNILILLTKYGADVNSVSFSQTAIIHSIQRKNLKELKHLVACGADINAKYLPYSYTITEACRKGNEDMVRALVKNGFDLNGRIHKEQSVLFPIVSLLNGDIDFIAKTVKVLTRLGADINITTDYDTVLSDVVCSGDTKMVKLLHSLGADVNKERQESLTIVGDLMTQLMDDYEELKVEKVKAFAEAGADIHSGFSCISPIAIAARKSDVSMVEALINLGANMNENMERDITPFHLACQLEHTNIAEFLNEKGVNITAECRKVEPLLAAIERW